MITKLCRIIVDFFIREKNDPEEQRCFWQNFPQKLHADFLALLSRGDFMKAKEIAAKALAEIALNFAKKLFSRHLQKRLTVYGACYCIIHTTCCINLIKNFSDDLGEEELTDIVWFKNWGGKNENLQIYFSNRNYCF